MIQKWSATELVSEMASLSELFYGIEREKLFILFQLEAAISAPFEYNCN